MLQLLQAGHGATDILPHGALGQWVAGGFVKRQIERMFAFRHDTTKRIVESGR